MKYPEFKEMYTEMMKETGVNIDILVTEPELIKMYFAVKVNAKWLNKAMEGVK